MSELKILRKINKKAEELMKLEEVATKVFSKLGDDYHYSLENKEVMNHENTNIKKYRPMVRVRRSWSSHAFDFDFIFHEGEIWIARVELETSIGETARAIAKVKNSDLIKASDSTLEMLTNLIRNWFDMDSIKTDQFYQIFEKEFDSIFKK